MNNDLENDDSNEVILIRATSKRNGFTTVIAGFVALIVASILISVLPRSLFLIGVFALSAGIVTVLIGWFKVREPEHSIEISKSQICYKHRHGTWRLDWQNIQRIDIPRITSGLEHKPLELVGIKLKDYQPLLASISPRLATNLLLEQRPLLLQNNQCATGGCYTADLIEDDKFKLPDGSLVTGIPAMLANRMGKLRASLGYDLYISAAELDRSTEDFVSLLRNCQSQVSNELNVQPK